MSYITEGDTHFCVYSSNEEDTQAFFHEACELFARLFMRFPDVIVASPLRRTQLPREQWGTYLKDTYFPVKLYSPGDEEIAPIIGASVEVPFNMAICIGPHASLQQQENKKDEQSKPDHPASGVSEEEHDAERVGEHETHP